MDNLLIKLLLAVLFALFPFSEAPGAAWEKGKGAETAGLPKLAYKDGSLVNVGAEALLRVEIVEPFYRYIGDIAAGQKAPIPDIATKFTVQYSAKKWLGGYETMKETFIPGLSSKGPAVGLDIKTCLRGDILIVKVFSEEEISAVFIEILSDIPVRISEDRVRYVLSSVGVEEQNIKRGPEARFRLCLLQEQEFYKVPIQVTFVYKEVVYDKMFFFSFKRKEFNDADETP